MHLPEVLVGIPGLLGLLIALTLAGNLVKGYMTFRSATGRRSLEKSIAQIRQKHGFVPLSQMSNSLIFCIVLAEDHLFFKHSGVSPRGICNALVLNLRKCKVIAGGSTITQQLAKNLLFSFNRSFSRKIAEVFAAKQIENLYSKNQILEIYINCIYYGCGYFGIEDASQAYFSSPPKELTLGQAMMIAAILPSPNRRNPKKHFNMARFYQKTLAIRMFREGFLGIEDAKNIYDTGELNDKAKNDQYALVHGDILDDVRSRRLGIPKPEPELRKRLMLQSQNILSRHTASGLVDFAQMCLTLNTCYILGGMGELITSELISRKRAQYPDHYSNDRVTYLRGLVGKDFRGFDCSGLIKSYYFNGIHRLSIDIKRDKCSSSMFEEATVKGNIETLPEHPGVCVYLTGHIGIYVGQGMVIESTINPIFGDGVVITHLEQRPWTHWLQCKFIEYCTF